MSAEVIVAEIAILLACTGLAWLQGSTTSGSGWTPALGIAGALAALGPAAAFGLHEAAGPSPLERFRLLVFVSAILPWLGFALLALMQPVTDGELGDLVFAAVLFVPLALLADAVVREKLIARSGWGADVLVIGSGEAAGRVAHELLAHPETGWQPIGYCGEPRSPWSSPRIPCVGSLAEIGELADAADIAVVVDSAGAGTLDLTRLPFNRIVVVPDFGPGISAVPHVGLRTWSFGNLAGFDFPNAKRARSQRCAKRVLDLAVAVPVLIFTLPLMLFTALAIWLVSPGPVVYVQHRVGLNGRLVPILKLRSMYHDAERRLEALLQSDPAARHEWEMYVKLACDPRILPFIGNFIRRTSIDELPQLWNVIRGDISLVGPRPFPAYHVEKFGAEFQQLRSSVRPGLTGLWQVSVRSSANLRQQEAIDTFYIRNWSLWLDLYIVLRTIPAVLYAQGAR